jgi:hypothetical protein
MPLAFAKGFFIFLTDIIDCAINKVGSLTI